MRRGRLRSAPTGSVVLFSCGEPPWFRHPAAAAEAARARAMLRPMRKRRSLRAESSVALSVSNSVSMVKRENLLGRVGGGSGESVGVSGGS